MEAEEKREDHFLGVMGADVPLKYLKDFVLRPLVSNIFIFDIDSCAFNLQQFSIECPKTKVVPATNQNKVYIIISQWELKLKTSKLLKARENASYSTSFVSD